MSESGYRVVIISHSVLAASSLHRQQVCRSNFYWGGKDKLILCGVLWNVFFHFCERQGCKSNWNSVILWGNQRLQYWFFFLLTFLKIWCLPSFMFKKVTKKLQLLLLSCLCQRKQLKKVVCFRLPTLCKNVPYFLVLLQYIKIRYV